MWWKQQNFQRLLNTGGQRSARLALTGCALLGLAAGCGRPRESKVEDRSAYTTAEAELEQSWDRRLARLPSQDPLHEREVRGVMPGGPAAQAMPSTQADESDGVQPILPEPGLPATTEREPLLEAVHPAAHYPDPSAVPAARDPADEVLQGRAQTRLRPHSTSALRPEPAPAARAHSVRPLSMLGVDRFETPGDRQIVQRIRARIAPDNTSAAFQAAVRVTAVRGVVTLRGEVDTELERRQVSQAAAEVAGREKLVNHVTVRSR